jgi:hypothetical protein
VVLLVIALVVGLQAITSLIDAQQRCFVGYPQVACPTGDDPRVGQLTLAFVGLPLVWMLGLGVIGIGWAVKGRRVGRGGGVAP